MVSSQDQGLFLKLSNFRIMGHCARNLLGMHLMLVIEETVQWSHFKLLEMYMQNTSLQFGLPMKAQAILLDSESAHRSKF